ncbi:MAG: response regulator [Gemmatimonadota bacterium]|nr:response regulator [Gemmatimonadota bacterium]
MNPLPRTPLDILLVEDNPGDVRLFREALDPERRSHLTIARDGVEAIAILEQSGLYADAPRPDIVVLDLNLPKKGGAQVLAEIKSHPRLNGVPVVMLTSSDAAVDVSSTYALGANCYVRKPNDLDEFIAAVRSIEDYWSSVAEVPPRGRY